MPIKILPLQKEDIPEVVDCIQQGFADDPYFQWVFDAAKVCIQSINIEKIIDANKPAIAE